MFNVNVFTAKIKPGTGKSFFYQNSGHLMLNVTVTLCFKSLVTPGDHLR